MKRAEARFQIKPDHLNEWSWTYDIYGVISKLRDFSIEVERHTIYSIGIGKSKTLTNPFGKPVEVRDIGSYEYRNKAKTLC